MDEKSYKGMRYLEDVYNTEHGAHIGLTVLALHWMTGEAESLRFMFEEVEIPLRVVYAQGVYPSEMPEGGWSWFPDGVAFYEARSLAQQAPDVRTIANNLADFLWFLENAHGGKFAVTGISQGGDLSLALALYHAETLDLALPMAGRLPPEFRPETLPHGKRVPQIVMLQGAADDVVPVATAREAHAWLKAQGCDADYHEYPDVGHGISEAMVADVLARLAEIA